MQQTSTAPATYSDCDTARPYVDPALVDAAHADPGGAAWEVLKRHCAASVFRTGTVPADDTFLEARLRRFVHLRPVFRDTLLGLGIAEPDDGFLFDLVLPLLDEILPPARAHGPSGCLIGLAGGPGVGKTTLSHVLATCATALMPSAPVAMRISIDDFYLSSEERARRGYAWRTLPGTHDLPRLHAFLDAFATPGPALDVPRYDLGRDRPGPDKTLTPAPRLCFFDGAMVGSPLPGYDRLQRDLDLLVFLDAPLSLLKDWRFARETALRARSGGALGYAPERMQAFWEEALEPSVTRFVRPNRTRADLVIGLGPERRILGLTRQTPQLEAEVCDA